MNIDPDELAREVTAKIRDEIGKLRLVDFAEVKTATQLANGGWTAQVLLPGATQLTTQINCLAHYTPAVGDWIMMIYPPGSSAVVVGKCPA